MGAISASTFSYILNARRQTCTLESREDHFFSRISEQLVPSQYEVGKFMKGREEHISNDAPHSARKKALL